VFRLSCSVAPWPGQLERSVASLELLMAKRIALYTCVGLITFLLSVSVVKLGFRHVRPSTPWQVLLSFQNEDLTKLPDKQRHTLQAAIDRIIGPQDERLYPFSPTLFRAITSTTGQTRYILISVQPLFSIPGEARVRMHVFDSAGASLSSDEFSGGWRTYVKGVSIAK